MSKKEGKAGSTKWRFIDPSGRRMFTFEAQRSGDAPSAQQGGLHYYNNEALEFSSSLCVYSIIIAAIALNFQREKLCMFA